MLKRIPVVLFLLMATCSAAGVAEPQEAMNEMGAVCAAKPAEVDVQTAVQVNVGNKVCPVSGEAIADPGKDTVEYDGKVYNLCCPMCKEEFLKNPEKYVAKVDEEMNADEGEEIPAEVDAGTNSSQGGGDV